MRSFLVAIVAGAGVLLASSAFAGPMTNGIYGVNGAEGTEQVRLVCDSNGRCFNTRGSRRAYTHRGAYAYQPRSRYYQQRRYNNRPGIGIRVPGVSIGVGGGRW